MPLRPYQQEQYDAAREALRSHRKILLQAPTGSGKTPLFSEITSSVYNKDHRAWIVVPRKELVEQASKHLTKWRVPHSLLTAGQQESRAFKIHVVSLMTLKRRYDKIKNWPKLIIIDEAHINYDAQIELIEKAPDDTFFISFTATPERTDGRGLSDIYDNMIPGKSIPWLMQHDFLTNLRYFAPRVEGINTVKRKGTEFDGDELEQVIKERHLYGDAVDYYRRYATVKKTGLSLPGGPTIKTNPYYNRGLPALGFFRTVKQAYDAAEKFRDEGFLFYCIEGNMKHSERKRLIEAHRNGEIDGLTNCEIATYGLDIPRIEYGFSMRPTLSRALYFQKVGRILRPFEIREGDNLKYQKQEAIFFDHANLIEDHTDPRYPGAPLFYIDDLEWNFYGEEKRKSDLCDTCEFLKRGLESCKERRQAAKTFVTRCPNYDRQTNLKLCPHLDMMYCPKRTCTGCEYNSGAIDDARKPLEVKEADFEEKKAPKLGELPPEEKREMIDRINTAVGEFESSVEILPGPVGELLKIADELGYAPLWVYYRLVPEKRFSVNVSLLAEIGRQKGYKPGWAHFKKKEIKLKAEKQQEEMAEYVEAGM